MYRIVAPMAPLIKLPIRIPTLALSIYPGFSLNPSLAIQIDRVKPTPAIKETPMMWILFMDTGAVTMLS
jgi:hypothetical protein